MQSAGSDRYCSTTATAPLCRREIVHYRRLDRAGRVDWVDLYAEPDLAERYGVSWGVAMQRIHLLQTNGRVVTGAHALAALWRRLARYRWHRRGACDAACNAD